MIASFQHNNFLIKVDKFETQAELDRVSQLTTGSAYNFQTKEWWSESFFHNFTWMPSGLWKRVFKTMQAEGYKVDLQGIKGFIDPITEDELAEWLETQSLTRRKESGELVPMELYWYQFDAVLNAVRYRISRNELDTGAGKSAIIYVLAKFLLQKRLAEGDKVLVVVNRRGLVSQLASKDFPSHGNDGYVKCDTIFSGGTKLAQSNVVIGTYQSLSEYDREYFSQFGAVIVDECHGALANSIKNGIMAKMNPKRLKYIHGLSATMHDDWSIQGLILESYLGPVIMRVPLYRLQEDGAVAEVRISVMRIWYPPNMTKDYWFDEDLENPSKKLPIERSWTTRQAYRMFCIGQACKNYGGNHILMAESLSQVNRLARYLAWHCKDYKVHVVHGGVSLAERDRIMAEIEGEGNHIVVATSETMGTGISVKKIHAIHLTDGGKSFIKIRQQIGRGVRLHSSKEYLMLFDWVDILKKEKGWPGARINVLSAHSKERMKIYDSRKIPYTIYDLTAKVMSPEEMKEKAHGKSVET